MNKTAAIIIIVIILALGIGAYVMKSGQAPAPAATGAEQTTASDQSQAYSLPATTSDDSVDSLERDANATNLDGIDAGMSSDIDSSFTKE